MGDFMKLFITLTKRRLFVILLIIVLGLAIMFKVSSLGTNMPDGSTNQKRVNYLVSLGIPAENTDVFSKEITIPVEFGEVYNKYNAIQLQSGFDLRDYKGEKATLYTYPVYGTIEVHIIVHKGIIIGGDIASTEFQGEMKPITDYNK